MSAITAMPRDPMQHAEQMRREWEEYREARGGDVERHPDNLFDQEEEESDED